MEKKPRKPRKAAASSNGGPRRERAAESPPRRERAAESRDPVDALLALAAVQGWRDTTMADVAARSGLSLAELLPRHPSKESLLAAYMQRLDGAMLGGETADANGAGDDARDRLFDTIMRRLDAMTAHKNALRNIFRELPYSPISACGLAVGPFSRSTRWMLAAAGLDGGGLVAEVRRRGLGLIYLAALRVWLDDDTQDSSKTMAALDRRLRQAESLWHFVQRPAGKAAPTAQPSD
jgi:ubiquinone biosynthesis protein COQ9